MTGWNEGTRRLITHWLGGLINGLASVEAPARQAILRECGKACAASYTVALFQEAREQAADMEGFLAALAVRFREAIYEMLNPRTIRVRYTRCACDLVTEGLITSPLICGCSAYNLQENFQHALGIPVSVTLESSILEGAPQCAFLISLERPPY